MRIGCGDNISRGIDSPPRGNHSLASVLDDPSADNIERSSFEGELVAAGSGNVIRNGGERSHAARRAQRCAAPQPTVRPFQPSRSQAEAIPYGAAEM